MGGFFQYGLMVIQQQHFISPHNIQEIKIYNNSTDDDGVLAARKNLRVKNARQPVKRKDV